MRVTLRTAALEILDEIKSDDRKKIEQSMYHDILEVQRFSEAVYESKDVAVQKLSNDLLKARVSGDVEVARGERTPWRSTNTTVRETSEFALKSSVNS